MWSRGSPVCHVCHTASQLKRALAANQAPSMEHVSKEMVSERNAYCSSQAASCLALPGTGLRLPARDSSLKQICRIRTAATNLFQLS